MTILPWGINFASTEDVISFYSERVKYNPFAILLQNRVFNFDLRLVTFKMPLNYNPEYLTTIQKLEINVYVLR